MAIYESAATFGESSSSSFSSLSVVVKAMMDVLLGGPVLRMRSRPDPYARMMRNDQQAKTLSLVRALSFWVCFAAVALAYSKRNISVEVWRSILKPPISPRNRGRTTGSNDPSSSYPQDTNTVEAVYALCRKLLRYAVDAWKKNSQQQQQEPHDLSPTQHRGSCHCGAVKFVVFAAKTLYVECAAGLMDRQYRRIVPYEYARIDTTALTWDEGNVQSYDCRYFFCPTCGVQLAHVTSNDADDEIQLFINVACLDGSSYILRPVDSRPPEATKSTPRPLNVPLIVPVTDHHHHNYAIVSESASIASKQQQQQRYPPSSPSVSALDDDLYSNMEGDDRITLGTAAASVASLQTTEELAVAAYRLRKALSSHSSPRAVPSPLVVDSQAECDDEDVDDNDPEDPSSTHQEASPTSSMPRAFVQQIFHEESSSSTAADADKLRRYLGKHVAS